MELELCSVLWRSIQKAHSAHSSRSRAGIRGRGLESGDLSLSIKGVTKIARFRSEETADNQNFVKLLKQKACELLYSALV